MAQVTESTEFIEGAEGAEPTESRATASELKLYFGTMISAQKARIAAGNRIEAVMRGVDAATPRALDRYRRIYAYLERAEAEALAGMAEESAAYPVWDYWLKHVKGIGPSLGSQLLAMLLPPIPEKGPSSWYRAAGLDPELRVSSEGVEEFRIRRPRAGEGAITYYKRLRMTLWNVAVSFIKTGGEDGYYRGVYLRRKAELRASPQRADWPDIRIDQVARWIMVKRFLAHLWEAWCEVEGIPNRKLYITEVPQYQQESMEAWMGLEGIRKHQYIPRPLPVNGRKI